MARKHEAKWKPVVGYEDLYQVSDRGKVRNKKGKLLALGQGRPQVSLYKRGTGKSIKVHTLVAAAFIGPRPAGLQVNHKDGNKRNNRVANLEYVTFQENMQHAIENGLLTGFDKIRKLSHEQVVEIKRMIVEGKQPLRQISIRYRVASETIYAIRDGRTWKQVPWPAESVA